MSHQIGNRDYSKAKIYKIVCNITGNIYIGSTLKPLCKRLAKHKSYYKEYLNGKRNYISSIEVLKNGDYNIVLISDYLECQNIEQLRAKERYYIESLDCVNKNIPGRTIQEYRKIYNKTNIDKLRQFHQQYKEDHKEELTIKRKEYKTKNKELLKQKGKKYYQQNKDKIAQKKQEYREQNKDIISERNKLKYQKNREKYLEKNKIKYDCECGKLNITYNNRLRHNKSQQHQNYLKSIQ